MGLTEGASSSSSLMARRAVTRASVTSTNSASTFSPGQARMRSTHASFRSPMGLRTCGRPAGAAAGVAVGALAWGLVTMDFSLAAVSGTTNRATTWPYRLAGLWGAMAGSLLWWSALLGLAGLAGIRTARRRLAHLERPVTLIV